MKLALTLHTVVLVFYALVLLLIPTAYLALYGVVLSPGAEVVVRFTGALAAGNAVLSWLSREQSSSGLQVVELTFALDWLLILIVGVLGQLAGAMNALGWTTVVLALVWVVVFGYLRFMRARAGPTHPACWVINKGIESPQIIGFNCQSSRGLSPGCGPPKVNSFCPNRLLRRNASGLSHSR